MIQICPEKKGERMCKGHGALIDSDYSVETLRNWKQEAEYRAAESHYKISGHEFF